MAHPVLAPSIGRDFDPFLFASIGADRHGQALSVISALARSDLDPWQEAINLSRMSRDKAIQRLSRLIAALPGEPAAARPIEVVASGLIALLPANRGLVPPLPETVAAVVARPDARFGIGLGAIVFLIAMGLLALMQSTPETGRTAGSEPQAEHAASAATAPRPAESASDARLEAPLAAQSNASR